MVKGYRTLSIPEELAKRAERYVSKGEWGYSSLAELVKDALRRRLEELEREERFRKVQERKGVFSDLDEHE